MATQLQEQAEEQAEVQEEQTQSPLSGGEDALPDDFDGDPTTEEHARALGWVPKDEYAGKGEWQDWSDFLASGKSKVPLLRAQVKKLNRLLHKSEKRYGQLETEVGQMKGFVTRAEQRGYDRALADLKSRQEEAVESGDVQAFRTIDKEIDELREEMSERKAEVDPIALREMFIEWQIDNDWYKVGGSDVMTAYADTLVAKYQRQGRAIDQSMLDDITEQVQAKFPAKFAKAMGEDDNDEGERPRKRSPVSAPSAIRPRPGGKTFADLPREAQALCDKWVSSGFMKDRAEYLKNYQW